MQTLPNKIQHLDTTHDKQNWDSNVYEQFLKPAWEEPLAPFGIEIKGYAHVWDPETEQGTHILRLLSTRDLNKAEQKKVKAILSQDDYGQPSAQYSAWDMPNIWVYIPYGI